MKRTALFAILTMTVMMASGSAYADKEIVVRVTSSCPSGSMNVCGIDYRQRSGTVGTVLNYRLPDKYIVNTFSVQCVNYGGPSYYRLLNNDVLSCAIHTCKPTDITLCQHSFRIDSSAAPDDVVNLTIPADMLGEGYAPFPPSVKVRCVLDNGVAAFRAEGAGALSCSIFKCQPAKLTLCNETLAVPDVRETGAVLSLKTPRGETVNVTCLGSFGQAPHYVISDRAAVTCP